MWRLNKIEARNLCTFRQVEYTLSQGVTTLVFGDNRDNDSQRSNGSGKSALIEAIALILTGSPLRKVRSEEIINDGADECCLCGVLINTATGEELAVERTLSRKGPSTVVLTLGGKPVAQPGVDAANRFLLEKLGISKEEVYNNFILSKYKYQEFLGASDSQKKEIINRFSNGTLVDQAIDRVAEDVAPVEKEASEKELQLANVQGRIDILMEQIHAEEDAKNERERTRAERIAAAESAMVEKRSLIRAKREQADVLAGKMPTLDKADQRLRELEKTDGSLEACLLGIGSQLAPLGAVPGDWDTVIAQKKASVAAQQQRLELLEADRKAAHERMEDRAKAYQEIKEEFRTFTLKADAQREDFEARMAKLEESDKILSAGITVQRQQKLLLTQAAENLKNKLSGTIVCPRCRHEFLFSDKAFDVEKAKDELREKTSELAVKSKCLEEANEQVRELDRRREQVRRREQELSSAIAAWKQKVTQAEDRAYAARTDAERISRAQRQVQEEIEEINKGIEGIRRRMFDEAFDRLDSIGRGWERQREHLLAEVAAAEGALETLDENLYELRQDRDMTAKLRESLKTFQSQSREILLQKDAIDEKLQRLQQQQERFAQFKTYLANTKIEALGSITNEFLENIGSDIRIRFSGYTVLKSGKVREKISISLLRDGVDCGSFGKFSAGEAARVNLATILSMQKLVNAGCEADKGLDLLVLDEIVEAVDEDGLQAMFGALNRLGITALVVSHGNIAESYPYKLIIRKENGVSRIEQ